MISLNFSVADFSVDFTSLDIEGLGLSLDGELEGFEVSGSDAGGVEVAVPMVDVAGEETAGIAVGAVDSLADFADDCFALLGILLSD